MLFFGLQEKLETKDIVNEDQMKRIKNIINDIEKHEEKFKQVRKYSNHEAFGLKDLYEHFVSCKSKEKLPFSCNTELKAPPPFWPICKYVNLHYQQNTMFILKILILPEYIFRAFSYIPKCYFKIIKNGT